MGVSIDGYVLPIPATNDQENAYLAALKRTCFKTPTVKHSDLRSLRSFVRVWCHKHLTPLPCDCDVSVEHWLENSNYNEARKQELRDTLVEQPICGPREYGNNTFIKLEKYGNGELMTYKCPRLINSRKDRYKVEIGPYIKQIEEEVYKLPYFIKHVPVRDRPRYIKEHVGGNRIYLSSDHTAFESHLTNDIQKSVELQLYKYMLKNLPNKNQILKHIVEGQMGTQVCKTRLGMTVVLPSGCRMSGDMTTSLGNGFTNLLVFEKVCHDKHMKLQGVVEGDDGLFGMENRSVTTEDLRKYGFDVKMKYDENVGSAGFCGQVFDEEDCDNVADPIEELISFSWTTASAKFGNNKTLKELLRAKGFSLVYEFPNCPVIRSFGDYILRCTGKGPMKFEESTKWWTDQVLMGASRAPPVKSIKQHTRNLVEKLYGVTVKEQLEIEHHFDNLNKLEQIALPAIIRHCSKYVLYSDAHKRFVTHEYI